MKTRDQFPAVIHLTSEKPTEHAQSITA